MIRAIVLIPFTIDFRHYAKGEAIELTTSELREMEASGIVTRLPIVEKEEKVIYNTKDEKQTSKRTKSN